MDHLDFWLSLLTLAALGYFLVWQDRIRPAVRRLRGPPAVVQRARLSANVVQQRSARLNAKKAARSDVPAFTERSKPNATSELPATISELQTLALIVVLYTRRSNKELAIEGATGATKGAGEAYQRWAKLFDAAMGEAARAAIKQKEAVL